jgi:dTDP-4-amino-4,6-dideoxygalactose transaminase
MNKPNYNIFFNKPCYSKQYTKNIDSHFENNDSYIKKCEQCMKEKYNFENTIFTTSCTHSLEMMAMILNIGNGDEVIVPSYTFVSTANAFVKFGATIKCLDSYETNPNMNIEMLENSITEKTKAVVIVHYAGWSVDMFKITKNM